MAYIIGVVSQKGGVGKSTISRLIAREYAAAEWDVLLADMDVSQATSFSWNSRRLGAMIEPEIQVMQFSTVDKAMKKAENYDIVIFDGAPHATRATLQIALNSDLIILPTGNSFEDLEVQVKLAHELVDNHIDAKKLSFVRSRVGSSTRENDEVQRYLERTSYNIINGYIPEKTGYRTALVEGKTLVETSHPPLNERAEVVVQSIINRLENSKK